MPVVPVKSSFQGAPFNRDVAAVIRNVRGAPVNFTTDLHGRLMVAQPHTVVDLSHASVDLNGWTITKYVVNAATITPASVDAGFRSFMLQTGNDDASAAQASSVQCATIPLGSTVVAMVSFDGISVAHPSQNFTNALHAAVGVRDTSTSVAFGGVWFLRGINSFTGEEDPPPTPIVNAFVLKNATSTLFIPQTDWNVDKLMSVADIANNPSRIQLDLTKLNTLVILRAPGSITIGFLYDSVFVPAHRVYVEDWPDGFPGGEFPYNSWRLDCWVYAGYGASGDNASIRFWGGSIVRDCDTAEVNGYVQINKTFGAGFTGAMASIEACAGSGAIFGTTRLSDISVACAAAIPCRLNVYKNCTLTGASWAVGSGQFPFVRTDTVGSISVIGKRVYSKYFVGSTDIDLSRVLGASSFLGSYYNPISVVPETYTIELTNASVGTVSEIYMSANWITSL